MQDSWTRFCSFVLLLVFALQIEALPKKNKGNTAASTGATGAAAAGGITTATDGSTILDKTVQIKYVWQLSRSLNCF